MITILVHEFAQWLTSSDRLYRFCGEASTYSFYFQECEISLLKMPIPAIWQGVRYLDAWIVRCSSVAGDGHQPNSKGSYTHYKDFLLKVG